jgi:SPX domain protein involved in polyphosphate accumulation
MNLTVPAETRCEIKFVANELEFHRLNLWLQQHPSCFYKAYPDRLVNNIYFDSLNHRSYSDNISGASSRIKVRYRWYGSSIQPVEGALEIKCKRNQYSWKIVYGLNQFPDWRDKSWRKLRSEMIERLPVDARKWMDSHPVPVLINRYNRKYFISRNENVRVTLDSDLSVYDQSRKPTPNYSLKTNLPKIFVLEVKFPRELRDEASQIIRDIPIRVSRHSKYITGFHSINGY